MNVDQHVPINVLCVLRGFEDPKLKYKITPYRIEGEDGRIYKIKEVRQCTRHRHGKTYQYQYAAQTKDDHFLEIWLDGATKSWRLTEEHTPDGAQINH